MDQSQTEEEQEAQSQSQLVVAAVEVPKTGWNVTGPIPMFPPPFRLILKFDLSPTEHPSIDAGHRHI
jgi:hypothetical protein